MKKLTITFIAALTILGSCKKDSDKKPDSSSRTIRYDVTGNFTANDQLAALPWSRLLIIKR